MTDEELAKIRERVEAATPGPWHVGGADVVHEDGSMLFEGESGRLIHTAEFIAHARQDVPALLAEVERLRALTETLLLGNVSMRKEKEAAMEIVQAVASFPEAQDEAHTPMALLMLARDKARALLASES